MSTLLEGLNNEQLKAITHQDGPLLIVAGAGTGKTTVITRRIAYLIEQGLAKPEEILALTFTEKASGEMEERVDQLLPLGSYDFWISTFHAFCQRILEQHGLDIGIANNFRLLDDVQQWVMLYRNFDAIKLNYYRPLGSPNKFIDALLDHFSKCKDEMITPEQYLEYAQNLKLAEGSAEELVDDDKRVEAERIEEVATAYHAYQKLLLDNEYLDFGDLINYTIELFSKRPNILKQYQQQFKYVLVDEFQDTNFAQYQLIKMLTGNANGTTANNLVVVGDDDQSIYKFRGASVSNILKLKEEFSGVTELTLVQNYRSSQNILDIAYDFIQANNPNRLEVKLHIDKKLHSNIPDVGHIEVLEGDDLASELAMVTNKIVQIKTDNLDCSWNDFAILIRANSAAEEMLPRLDTAGIPYTFMANRGLYRKKIIADIINYLKLLDNYHESSALYRVLQYPKFSIDPNELALITSYANKKTLSLYEALKEVRTIPNVSETSALAIEKLLQSIHNHTEQVKERTAIEVFVTLIDDLGIRDQLSEDTLQNATDRDYLDQFFKKIESFEEQNEDKTLRNFMSFLKLEMQAGSIGTIKFDPNSGPETLKVMTVHSSKGLEFKYVFIIGMVDQRFPTRAKSDSIKIPEELIKDILPEGDAHLQEERRLFYVALTRAKTNLYLSWAKDYGGAKAKKPSLFLQETNLVPSEKISKATGKIVFTKKVQTHSQEVYKNLPTVFSFSDIAIFENCPLDYKFKMYLKLPMPGAPQLSFGKTIHKVLQHFALHYRTQNGVDQQALFGENPKEKTIPDFTLMEKWYSEFWIDEWYHSKKEKEDYRSEGIRMLTQVFDDFTVLQPTIKYIEQPFELPLGEYTIKGRIDRADLITDNNLVIIDYKTNGVPKVKNKRDLDQLRLYQWAAEEVLHEQVTGLVYWHLKDNVKAEQKLATSEDLKALKVSVLESIEDIRNTIKYDLFSDKHGSSKQHKCSYEDLL